MGDKIANWARAFAFLSMLGIAALVSFLLAFSRTFDVDPSEIGFDAASILLRSQLLFAATLIVFAPALHFDQTKIRVVDWFASGASFAKSKFVAVWILALPVVGPASFVFAWWALPHGALERWGSPIAAIVVSVFFFPVALAILGNYSAHSDEFTIDSSLVVTIAVVLFALAGAGIGAAAAEAVTRGRSINLFVYRTDTVSIQAAGLHSDCLIYLGSNDAYGVYYDSAERTVLRVSWDSLDFSRRVDRC